MYEGVRYGQEVYSFAQKLTPLVSNYSTEITPLELKRKGSFSFQEQKLLPVFAKVYAHKIFQKVQNKSWISSILLAAKASLTNSRSVRHFLGHFVFEYFHIYLFIHKSLSALEIFISSNFATF